VFIVIATALDSGGSRDTDLSAARTPEFKVIAIIKNTADPAKIDRQLHIIVIAICHLTESFVISHHLIIIFINNLVDLLN